MNHDHIPGFLNHMPFVYWHTYLPNLKYEKGDDVSLHLVKFHMYARKLSVQFPEDCMMKMFMSTLEEQEISWYEGLPPCCIYSLVDFHMMFYENFKEEHPSLMLVKDCCKHFQGFIRHLESLYGDEELMDE